MTKKIIGLCLVLSACQKLDEQVVIPQEISRTNINMAVNEDDEGQVVIVEIEDEAQFVGSDDMIRIAHCFHPFEDSTLQVYEKRRLQEKLKTDKDSI